MTKTLKHKVSNYKLYKIDIWGIIRSYKCMKEVYFRNNKYFVKEYKRFYFLKNI